MRFIESILFKDGDYYNLKLHQDRINRTFEIFLPSLDAHDLHKILPKLELEGKYKVRLVYNADEEDGTYDLEFSEYQPRNIKTLEVVESERFDYSFKFEDRKKIAHLAASAEADDIIIAIDDYITDGSYSNLVFWNGQEWLTPDTPLLKGIRRTELLGRNKIKEAPIQISDLGAFEKVSLINAMLDLGEIEVPLSQVRR